MIWSLQEWTIFIDTITANFKKVLKSEGDKEKLRNAERAGEHNKKSPAKPGELEGLELFYF